MSKFLIDTDVLINHLKGRKILDPKILKAGAGLSIISLGELLHGAYRSNDPEKNLDKIGDLLSLGISEELLDVYVIDRYARLKAELEMSGQKLDEFDLLIAATAITREQILITNNVKHFKRIKNLKLQALS